MIKDISSKSIIISTVDGSFKTIIWSQIILIDHRIIIKEAKWIAGNVSPGSLVDIIKYNPKKDSCKIKFYLQNEHDSFIDIIKAKERRTNKPLEFSKIELEFFKNCAWCHQELSQPYYIYMWEYL
jgi:hypothetical protein